MDNSFNDAEGTSEDSESVIYYIALDGTITPQWINTVRRRVPFSPAHV